MSFLFIVFLKILLKKIFFHFKPQKIIQKTFIFCFCSVFLFHFSFIIFLSFSSITFFFDHFFLSSFCSSPWRFSPFSFTFLRSFFLHLMFPNFSPSSFACHVFALSHSFSSLLWFLISFLLSSFLLRYPSFLHLRIWRFFPKKFKNFVAKSVFLNVFFF